MSHRSTIVVERCLLRDLLDGNAQAQEHAAKKLRAALDVSLVSNDLSARLDAHTLPPEPEPKEMTAREADSWRHTTWGL